LTLWELGVVVALAGTGQALFAPAFGSIVPEIVPRELLPQANSLDQFVRTSAGLVGPAIAGVVIAVAGVGWAFAIDSATFVVSTSTALALTPRPFEPNEGHRSVFRDVREGFGFVRAQTWLWATLVAGAFANIASSTRNVLLPFVVKYDLHSTAKALGFVYSAAGAGALISAYLFGQHGLPRRPIVVAYIGWGLSIFMIGGYGLSTSEAELLVFGFVGGFGMAICNGIWGTLMHQLVPRNLLGRVTSIDWMMSLSLMPVAAAASGAIAAAVGARATLVGSGLLGGGVCVLFLLLSADLRRSHFEPPGQTTEP
jgi:MFS family permease